MDVASLVSQSRLEAPTSPKSTAIFRPSPSSESTYRRSLGTNDSPYFTTTTTSTTLKRSAQRPPSPPAEAQRHCSLPSISALLQGVDSVSFHAAKRQKLDPVPTRDLSFCRSLSQGHESMGVKLPPTPPLRPGSGYNNSSAASSTSHSPTSSANPGFDKYHQQHLPPTPMTLPSPTDRSSLSSGSSTSRMSTVSGAGGPYASPASSVLSYSPPVEVKTAYYPRPSISSARSFAMISDRAVPTPAQSHPHPSSISKHPHQQPPVASSAPPSSSSSSSPPALSSSSSTSSSSSSHQPSMPAATWQHHHYFPASTTTAPFQQTQDRYICRTCHKAFSRPSSLRIHSHSHTGEKPFRCTHAGCGKAFSVRSNMKRHERGCHSGRAVGLVSAGGGAAAATAMV